MNDVPARAKRIMVPIDIPAIAQHLGVEVNSVFGRLYYHLEPKYGEKPEPGKGRRAFFAPIGGDDPNRVNFPLLEAVLAGLWEERDRNLQALWISAISITVAAASLLVSVLT